MVTAPPQLVWQLIKRNNCFIVNGLHGKKFSSEPGNLYNLHSYKHSGAHARSAWTPPLRVACSWGSAACRMPCSNCRRCSGLRCSTRRRTASGCGACNSVPDACGRWCRCRPGERQGGAHWRRRRRGRHQGDQVATEARSQARVSQAHYTHEAQELPPYRGKRGQGRGRLPARPQGALAVLRLAALHCKEIKVYLLPGLCAGQGVVFT
jgi:hypothetical protein